jgi:hypothetical protein
VIGFHVSPLTAIQVSSCTSDVPAMHVYCCSCMLVASFRWQCCNMKLATITCGAKLAPHKCLCSVTEAHLIAPD